MKKIMIMILLVMFSSLVISVVAQPVPEDVDTMTANKVSQEHQTTRQYISNELTKKEKIFFDEFTKRADYYERSYEEIMTGTVIKLGLLWAGILIFFVSFNKLVQTKTEKQKYAVLKEAIKKDIITDFQKDRVVMPEEDIKLADELKKQNVTKQQHGFLANLLKKKEKDIEKEKEKEKKEKEELEKKERLERLQISIEKKRKIKEMRERLDKMERELNGSSR